jgi:hypothetical protein
MELGPKKDEVVSAFLEHLPEAPLDLWFPKRGTWVGLDPKPQWHVEVVYHDGADKLLHRVADQDSRLFPLRERLKFELDKTGARLHVFLSHSLDLSIP